MNVRTKLLLTAVILGGATSGLAGSASALPALRSLAFESSAMPIENVQMRHGGGGGGGGAALRGSGGGGAAMAAPRMGGNMGPMTQGMRSGPRMGSGTITGGVRTDGSFRSAQGTWRGDHRRGRGWLSPGIGFAFGGYGYPYYDDYAYAPGYYADDYYSQGYAGGGDVAYCQQTYRSYDPASGTYLGYDGLRHPCP